MPEGLGLSGLEVLFEAPGLPAFELPAELATVYGGSLGFEEPRVFANFVSTIDGVVAIPSLPSSNKIVAGGSAADRFVLGLLRACCDVLVIGSGTMAASPRSIWTAEQGYPPAAAAFAELRQRLGRPPEPEVAVISGSGRIDPNHPAFAAGRNRAHHRAGAARLQDGCPTAQSSRSARPSIRSASRCAAERGHRLILSEGGPHAIAPFLEAGLVDELFLTISPLLAGRRRRRPARARRGVDLIPAGRMRAADGVRRDGGHLFLRYQLDNPARPLRHLAPGA